MLRKWLIIMDFNCEKGYKKRVQKSNLKKEERKTKHDLQVRDVQ